MDNYNEYFKEWDKKNRKAFNLRFNVKNDSDILEWIEKIPNFQKYIKDLIRKDIIRNK